MPLTRIAAAALALLLAACSSHAPTAPANGRIRVLTTISTFNSFVNAVGGDRVTVSSLVPIGASPEMFVRIEGRRIETCPIAGTARRTGDPLRKTGHPTIVACRSATMTGCSE